MPKFVSQYILGALHPPRSTCNVARVHATRCASSPVRALRSWEDQSAIACARSPIGPVGNAPFAQRPGDVCKEGEEGCAGRRVLSCGMRVSNHHTHPTDPIRDKKTEVFDTSMASPSRQHNFTVRVSHRCIITAAECGRLPP